MKNIWGNVACVGPRGERCTACCIANLCAKTTPEGCPDYENRPLECRAFHCGNPGVTEKTRDKLREVSE